MLKLATSVTGTGRAPLVLLHGWGMGAAVWKPLLPLLEKKYRIYVMDLPGYGVNAGVHAESLESIAELILESTPGAAHWLGWSLGGLVAMKVAELSPMAVERLTLVASSPRFVQGSGWPNAMVGSQLEQFAAGLLDDYEGTLKRFIALQFYGQKDARDASRALQNNVVGRPVNALALANGLRLLREEDLRSVYAGLNVPVQHVYGSMDRLVPVRVGGDLTALNGRVDQIVMQGVGHAPFVSHPALFVEKLGL